MRYILKKRGVAALTTTPLNTDTENNQHLFRVTLKDKLELWRDYSVLVDRLVMQMMGRAS
jgi:hypothetical protein